jgi:hypothetical protein
MLYLVGKGGKGRGGKGKRSSEKGGWGRKIGERRIRKSRVKRRDLRGNGEVRRVRQEEMEMHVRSRVLASMRM